MKKAYKLDFQKIRRKTQVKDFLSFELYLKNIFSDIAKREWSEKEQKGIDKLSFIEYMNIPFIVGEKLFNALDKNKKGYLTKNEFVNGIISLYVGDLEETQKMIFKILDFDGDGVIIPEDSRLLISFIKNLSEPPSAVIKQKLQRRTTITDEENLEELNELINNFFNKKQQMTFEEYKYNIENINSDVFFVFIYFLYDNKPFTESAIKILKLLSNAGNLTSSFSSSVMNSSSEDCTADSSKFRVKSPSKTFKSFIYDLVDVDVDEIERECVGDENEDESENIEEYTNLLNEELIEIKIPEFNSRLDITEKKSDKDYPSHPSSADRENTGLGFLKKNIDSPDANNKNKVKSLSNLNISSSAKDCANLKPMNVNKPSKSIFSTNKGLKKEFLEERTNVDSAETKMGELNLNKNVNENIHSSYNNIFIDCPISISTSDRSEIFVNNQVEKKKFNITINNSLHESNNPTKFAVGNKKEFKNEEVFSLNSPQLKSFNSTEVFKFDASSNKLNNSKNNSNLLDSLNDSHLKLSKMTSINSKISSSNNLGFDSTQNTNRAGQTVDDLIIPADIIYEGYIFKSRSNNKLKKYYLVLIGMDLFYFSNSKKTKLKGMHNLSGSYIYEDGDLIKVREETKSSKGNSGSNEPNTVNYYPFKLCFKKKSRMYYCPKETETKDWIRCIRNATKFRDVKDFYTFGENLGKGKFGNVKLGVNKSDKTQVAIKTISKANLKGIETEMVKTETEIMRFCRHENIVRLIDNFEDIDNIYIILEFLSGGNLNNFLSQQQTILPEKKIKEIVYQIGAGIKYLHHFGILHRDLKPENLMMSDKNNKLAVVKIVDFGLSKILGVTEKSNDAYGTLSYAAPEVITKLNYNNTIDIWSMGVILFFLICGYLPFNDKNNDVSKIAKDITKANVKFDDSIWEDFSPYARQLTMRCLERDLNKRINIKEFLEHKWFKEV